MVTASNCSKLVEFSSGRLSAWWAINLAMDFRKQYQNANFLIDEGNLRRQLIGRA